MENDIKFASNVILVDVSFLNVTASEIKSFASRQLGRKLPDVDLPTWLSYLTLDAGLHDGNNEIQVLLVHDGKTSSLSCCRPSDLEELDGMACRTPLGEFTFSYVTAAGITSSADLFLDLMDLAWDAENVELLALVPFHGQYADWVEDELWRLSSKKMQRARRAFRTVYFTASSPKNPIPCRHISAFYSLSYALGIQPGEL